MKLSRLKRLFLLLACAMLLGFAWLNNVISRVEMKPWPVKTDGQFITPVSKVAMFQSNRAKAKDITYDDIVDLVNRAVEAAGGLESIISDGDTVILKPNLVSANGRVPEVNGVTTDVRVVRAVSEIVRRLDPHGVIIVLEGAAPSGEYTKDMFELYEYSKANLPEVDDIIALEDVCGNDKEYDSPELVSVSLPDSISLYPDDMKPNKSRLIYLAKLFYNADVVITIPVMKNHESAALTCGVKNTSIGMTPPSIYRNPLYNIPNLRFEIDHSFPNMHKWIHDFFTCRPTNFVIVDALQGLQNGPGGLDTTDVRNMRLIMASRDIVANDAIAALTIGMDPAKINYLVYLHNDGLGCADPTLIRVEGNVLVSDVKKKFAHSAGLTKAAMYTDFSAPDVAILSAVQEGDVLVLSLDVSSETVLVEVAIDDVRLERAVISGFDNIRLEGVSLSPGSHEVLVYAYDKYLNASIDETAITSVEEKQTAIAASFQLLPNYPNPFNPSTIIPYELPADEKIMLTVMDINGRVVQTLIDGAEQKGHHQVVFNGANLPSGNYFYQLRTPTYVGTKKMVLIK
jgi:uncharacterized protein (DUF362 family)